MSAPQPATTAYFSVTADADPGLLPRLVALIAKRGLIPTRLHAFLDSSHEILSVELEMEDLSAMIADHIGLCIGQIPGVTGVAREAA